MKKLIMDQEKNNRKAVKCNLDVLAKKFFEIFNV